METLITVPGNGKCSSVFIDIVKFLVLPVKIRYRDFINIARAYSQMIGTLFYLNAVNISLAFIRFFS